MIDELELVRQARPEVRPPGAEAREAACRALDGAIAGRSGPSRRRWRRRGRRLARRWPGWGLALGLVATAFVVAIFITGLRHQREAPAQRHVLQQPQPPVVRNYAHGKLPPLPRGSVRYFSGHLGASAYSLNPRDTFVLTTTHAASHNLSVGPTHTPSTLTIRASGLKPAPRGSVYAVWLTLAVGGNPQLDPVLAGGTNTARTPLRLETPFSLVGIIQPPIGADGELTARAPADVPVLGPGVGPWVALLITIERNPNAKTPGRAVLVGVVS